jgi:hypothetical protein
MQQESIHHNTTRAKPLIKTDTIECNSYCGVDRLSTPDCSFPDTAIKSPTTIQPTYHTICISKVSDAGPTYLSVKTSSGHSVVILVIRSFASISAGYSESTLFQSLLSSQSLPVTPRSPKSSLIFLHRWCTTWKHQAQRLRTILTNLP